MASKDQEPRVSRKNAAGQEWCFEHCQSSVIAFIKSNDERCSFAVTDRVILTANCHWISSSAFSLAIPIVAWGLWQHAVLAPNHGRELEVGKEVPIENSVHIEKSCMFSHLSKAPVFPETGQHNKLGPAIRPKLYFPFLIKLIIPCKC